MMNDYGDYISILLLSYLLMFDAFYCMIVSCKLFAICSHKKIKIFTIPATMLLPIMIFMLLLLILLPNSGNKPVLCKIHEINCQLLGGEKTDCGRKTQYEDIALDLTAVEQLARYDFA